MNKEIHLEEELQIGRERMRKVCESCKYMGSLFEDYIGERCRSPMKSRIKWWCVGWGVTEDCPFWELREGIKKMEQKKLEE